MPGVALIDVNVLIALTDPDHVHHELAHDWFAEEGAAAWATCPLTENGFVRVLANPNYHSAQLRPTAVASMLRRLCAAKGHQFWPDSVSLADSNRFDLAFVAGHRQLTDVYRRCSDDGAGVRRERRRPAGAGGRAQGQRCTRRDVLR